MCMENSIKNRIREVIKREKLKNKEFAKIIEITENSLNGIFKTDFNVKSDILIKIANKFPQYSMNWLLTGKDEMLKSTEHPHIAIQTDEGNTKAVYLYDVSAAAGYGNFDEMISNEKVIGKYIVPDFKNADWMIYVKGSSMYPKYSSGDIIACRVLYESKFIQWGKVYVVATREQGILVKRLKKSEKEDCIKAVSDNTGYDSFDIPKDEILGIALVIGVIRME